MDRSGGSHVASKHQVGDGTPFFGSRVDYDRLRYAGPDRFAGEVNEP